MVGTTVIIIPLPTGSSGPARWWLWALAGVALVAVGWMACLTIKDMIEDHRDRSGR